MPIKKATTTEDLTASAEATDPTPQELVDRVEEHTAPEVVARVDDVQYVKVKSPTGDVTTVPEGILDALLESGYSKSK
ncbi:hypothetical protein FB382_004401 [Nocardioides ginsengisegetis]|uniref:Uncharacterized protein n=1 Tax=Nocardioides ginsengisegetis TaxID=661491 RepID=A0A7W3PBT7_9ACTN|nr:hypothetical protein [Nocardioides ginsengisegetis]MBA8806038.1 hypothetical protein [Nocardioides ginsengisegetis]MBA8806049.1 hypothetical protein [Nocardioides ginsengisegetis]